MEVVQDVLSLPSDILAVFELFKDTFQAFPAEIRAVSVLCLSIVCLFGMAKMVSVS
jgi:hypothetical protein